ncbi:MAG: hypothetical protein KAU27_05170, partial [Desulfuromonadales bacterium]|nr:hypothetical protein [Desulfuromonadales bacterium]
MKNHHQAVFLIFLLLILLSASNALSQVNEGASQASEETTQTSEETTQVNDETAPVNKETTSSLATIDELLIQNETEQAWEVLEGIPE